jgi:ubiquinone/menaquinone biosynthesis C-methylase UbiE
VFSPDGPSAGELARQALSSVEHGYDLLAPKFDRTPFRTSAAILDATAEALASLGPFGPGLDVCCGTGAGLGVLEAVCQGPVTGVDFSAGMLAQARLAYPGATLLRADARALPFTEAFDLAVSFGALGHFLPAERPTLFAGVHRSLGAGGVFALPVPAPLAVTSPWYWALLGFDGAMHLRNALWSPPFEMYYLNSPLSALLRELTGKGFTVQALGLPQLGQRADGRLRCGLLLATKARATISRGPGRSG